MRNPSPSRLSRAAWSVAALAAMTCPPAALAAAQPSPTDAPLAEAGPSATVSSPNRVEVTGHYDNAIGSSDAASQGVIRADLIKSRPALRPGEVLEFVPGMIVTQHSGDGKANQYFLRGFNLDHGTDFATTVGSMPVNMPSHAHGQGYTDLNFLIPELVQRIDYRKGPYFASSSDFASAGAADISYRNRLDTGLAQLTLGEHGYRRGLLGGSTETRAGNTLLAAVELMSNDGPWTVKEGLRRSNSVLSASGGTEAQGWSASMMGYNAQWTSTDQIPQRLIDAGRYNGQAFGRYDTLDATDGGNTARASVSGQWHRHSDDGSLTKLSAYAMRYRLQLWSNFSYALDHPVQGDQFLQQDARSVFGLSASHAVDHLLAGLPARSEVGLQLRHDRIRVGLADTTARQITATTRDDAVRQTLAGLYGQTAVELTGWLRGIAGLRADRVDNRVQNQTANPALAANAGQASASQLSPKLSLIAGPFQKTEFFLNAGRGLHSNDARGTTIRVDPKNPASAVDKVAPLVASRGYELGTRTEIIPGLQSSLALWTLDFDSELVYVGDAGATEASAASKRRGIEFNNRWTPAPWLLLDADLAWTHSRFVNGDRIPNAVDRVASLSASLREIGPWSASLQWRYLGAGALTEDNSVRSIPSLTANLRISRSLNGLAGPDSALTLDVFNLFDRRVDDIQYVYASQPRGLAAQVDRHVHPAEPRSLRLTLRWGF